METIEKQFYRIQEVAEIVGVAPSALRYWEKEFPEIAPRRGLSNIRHYTPADIEKIRMIHYLVKVKGLKLEAAKEQLRVNRGNISHEMEIINRLDNVKQEMKQLLKAFSKREQNSRFPS